MKRNLNKYILWIVLAVSWLALTFIYLYSRSNLTVIPVNLSDNALTQKTFNEILAGQKITGEFTASENYLGQLLVRFYNYDRINKDSVIFRLREKGQSGWYYEHTYKTDQFLPNGLFTFGFPPIIDSKGKAYEFEIVSVEGKAEDAVTLSQKRPLAALEYQYPKVLLIKSPSRGLEFVEGKITNFKIDRDFLIALVTYVDFMIIILFLEYLFLNTINRQSFRVKSFNGVYILASGLILLLFSSVLLYLKQLQISQMFTIISYFIIIFGTLWLIIEQRIKKN